MSGLTGYQAARVAIRHRRCKHFNGIFGQPPCGVGVDLVAKVGPRTLDGWLQRIPCRVENAEPTFQCDQRDVPAPATAEEIAEAEEQLKQKLSQMIQALATIAACPGSQGIIECPACHGPLSWSRASLNGHVWGRCSTDGCLSWMQ